MFLGTHLKAVYLWYESMLKYCLYSQKQVGKWNNLCSCVKSFAHQMKTSPTQPHHFSSLMRNFLIRIKRQTARTIVPNVMTLRMSLLLCTTKTGWRPSLMNHWLKGMWPPSSPYYKPLDYFMWSEIEREVKKQPHSTLASLKVKIS